MESSAFFPLYSWHYQPCQWSQAAWLEVSSPSRENRLVLLVPSQACLNPEGPASDGAALSPGSRQALFGQSWMDYGPRGGHRMAEELYLKSVFSQLLSELFQNRC